jgi:predicted ArsR family transcriptional regulator
VKAPPTRREPGAAPTNHALLVTLRRFGPLTSSALATRLGRSRSTVLEQLVQLVEAGLVQRRIVRHGVGRPPHLYDVTPLAQGLLPAGYEALAMSLLEAAREVGGPDLIKRVFEARRRARTSAIKAWFTATGMDPRLLFDRACELAELQDQDGYMAEVSRRGAIRLHEHNCPVLGVAKGWPAVCESERRLFSDVLEADVRRETSMATGGRSCTYRIEARGWDSRGWDVHQYYESSQPTHRERD